MNFQLAAIVLLIILYPLGFWIAKTRGDSFIGIPVLVIFIASFIYLLISSWVLLLMMIGSGALFVMGFTSFDTIKKIRMISEDNPNFYSNPESRVKQALVLGLLLTFGGIYLFILSIARSLR